MRTKKWTMAAVAAAALGVQCSSSVQAGLFKIDFGQLENQRIPVDMDGNPTGPAPENLKDWDVLATWTFAEPNANVPDGAAGDGYLKGTANAAGDEVTWKLRDFSTDKNANVTMTLMDNKALAEAANPETPPYMLGQTANNPTKEAYAAVYDGVVVPAIVKDDYMYRNPDTAGTEVLMRFAGLTPGFYNVTVFEGRTSDGNGRFGKVWVDDITGKKEPATQNTGNYSGTKTEGGTVPLGQPRTVNVEVKAGQFLWFAEMEDNSGGISGLIIQSSTVAPPPVDITTSTGLFKIDFGQLENERVPVDAEGNPTGEAPKPVDWNVIPTWTFADPNANVTAGSSSISGTANAAGDEVTWKLTDFSKVGNKNVTLTMMDNKALAEAANPETPPYSQGQTANNPTKDGFEPVYDGVVVPYVVKDDYLYRNPDTAGTETLMRFAGLNPGTYNVTVFEGRSSDSNGRFGKVWVDDITGKKEPATQNTGNYSGVNLDVGGIPTPVGNPKTVTVTLKAGEYLWFAEMEDNSGGISGMIIRGTGSVAPATVELVASATVNGAYAKVDGATIDTAAKSITIPATGSSRFVRVKGSNKITSSAVTGGNLVIKYE